MSKKKPTSMELRSVRGQVNESPPPPPSGATVREWFAGLALMNPELMKGVSPEDRAREAARLANELVDALRAPRVPSNEAIAPPTDEQLAAWDAQVAAKRDAKERRERDTVPNGRKLRASIPPPPNNFAEVSENMRRASERPVPIAKKPEDPLAGRYCSLIGPIVQDDE